jgi:hypothetical protein
MLSSELRVPDGNDEASSRHPHRPTRLCANATVPYDMPEGLGETDDPYELLLGKENVIPNG